MNEKEIYAQLLVLQKQLSTLRLQTLRRLNPNTTAHPALSNAINKCIAIIASSRYSHTLTSEALDEAETLADILNNQGDKA